MRKITVAVAVTIVGITLAGLGILYLQSMQEPGTGTLQQVTVGIPPTADSSGLVYIAEEEGFFTDNGLNVTIRDYDVGLRAVDGMIKNENDIAVATEFVIVGKAFEREKICGIATVARYEDKFIIGRKDHGIVNASDLAGKRIGCDQGTISEFFLGRFLELHHINMTDVSIIDIKRAQFVDAIGNGTVDAIIVWGPEVYAIQDRLGTYAVSMPAQSGQMGYWLAICRSDWAAEHPELVDRFLRSMDRAVDYTVNHPAEAKAIMKKWLNADEAYIEKIWSDTQFSLSLDESLITAMEDEARWMISNDLAGEKSVPDFGDYVCTMGLEEVRPESVNIIT